MDENPDFSNLPKKERKRLKREMDRQEQLKGQKKGRVVKWFVIGALIILVAVGLWLLLKGASEPLPGQQFPNQGRDHVGQDQWEKFTYNSNPPTSGPHDEEWTKAGIYDAAAGDGHLVHSLEHGYIIISYTCGGNSDISQLSEQDCNTLKKQLSDLANDKKIWKLIVVPRPNLDQRLALTAWTWVEKLDGFDKEKITAFIDAHRNHGPEQTME